MDFTVELYDPMDNKGMNRFPGDDTVTKVTILDEDFPGQLSFDETQVTVSKSDG